ncbi:MAG: CRISPR-associated endonuclease Cas2 [Methanobacteriota archaeon]|nr:MAG: CRISPR-associated endonuclease Cas2 [Euryarchaeota archaeon]
MQYVIAYDITENDIRTKISDLLIAKGFLRLQKSVFIGDTSKAKLKELKQQLNEVSKGATGVINFFSQCTSCRNRQLELLPEPEETQEKKAENQEKVEEKKKEEKRTEEKKQVEESIPIEKVCMPIRFITPKDLAAYYQKGNLEIQMTTVTKLKKRKGKTRIKTKVIEIRTGVFLSDLC